MQLISEAFLLTFHMSVVINQGKKEKEREEKRMDVIDLLLLNLFG